MSYKTLISVLILLGSVGLQPANDPQPTLANPQFGVRPINARSAELAQDGVLSLEVAIIYTSPGHLLLTDPSGRRTGFDPAQGKIINEIPEASYTLSTAMDSLALPDDLTAVSMQQPTNGTYQLQVIGTDSTYYLLRILAYDSNNMKKGIAKHFVNVPITNGEVHKYQFQFSNKEGPTNFRGGYYGEPNEDEEVNALLTYAYPPDRETSLITESSSVARLLRKHLSFRGGDSEWERNLSSVQSKSMAKPNRSSPLSSRQK